MSDPELTPTQVRQFQNQLEALLDQKAYRSVFKEETQSWSLEKVKKLLRKKRLAFDHQLVSIFKDSMLSKPDDLCDRFEKVWDFEIEKKLFKFISDNTNDKATGAWGLTQMGSGIALGLPSYLAGMSGGSYVRLIDIVNERWKAYCEKCVHIAKKEAQKQL